MGSCCITGSSAQCPVMTNRGGIEGGGVVGGMFKREYMYTLVCILYCVCVCVCVFYIYIYS